MTPEQEWRAARVAGLGWILLTVVYTIMGFVR